jgi:predicted GNAT family acetyltransferase
VVAIGYVPTMPSELTIRDRPEKNRFETELGDGTLAIAEYRLHEGKIVFTHTEVPPEHEGQGIGSALIRFALRAARQRGLKVVPVCPFFAAYIKKHAEEQDLLDASSRARLGLD